MVTKSDNFRKVSNDISFLVNCAIGCSKIKKIMVEEKNGRMYSLRPSLHIILHAPVGQAKSTILGEVSSYVKREIVTELTRAGLVGTIDSKTLQFISGCAWESRNSLMLLDEFTFGKKKEGWEVFLQLLESQRWGKRIGVFSGDQLEEDEDLYFKVSKGRIDIKTRFSCIIATMKKFEYRSGQTFRAFVSRCVPYNFNMTEQDLDLIASGEPVLRLNNVTPKTEILIKKGIYNRIRKDVMKALMVCPRTDVRKELFLRSVGDCCRMYAVLGKSNFKLTKRIIDWKIESHMLIGKYYGGKDDGRDREEKD